MTTGRKQWPVACQFGEWMDESIVPSVETSEAATNGRPANRQISCRGDSAAYAGALSSRGSSW